MTHSRPQLLKHVRTALMALALVGLLGRALVPTGYMLDRSGDTGSIIVRICGGMDEQFARLNLKTGEFSDAGEDVPPTPGQSDDGVAFTCPFALSAVFDLPAPLDWTVPEAHGPPLLGAEPIILATHTDSVRPPLPPRGPPPRA